MRQASARKSLSDNIIQQHFVAGLIPDGAQSDASWAVQNELISATATAAFELQDGHRKMILKQVLFATQCQMHKVVQIIQSTYVRRCGGHLDAGGWLIHKEQVTVKERNGNQKFRSPFRHTF